jgi:hypothetical protein
MEPEQQSRTALPWVLATFPILSFVGQYYFSAHAGTLPLMLRHPTVMYADWIFIPFNFLVARIIDWKRGLTIYVIVVVATCLVIATHALWQVQGTDPGHMITKGGVVLGAGWIHIAFSIVEMVLLVAFVFCRKSQASLMRPATGLATVYFLAMAVCGYWIHHRIILSDACVFVGGMFFLFAFPMLSRVISRNPSSRQG